MTTSRHAKALFPGSFDPFTLGHLDLVERSVKLFSEVWVGIALSGEKKPLATVAERKKWMEACFTSKNIHVVAYEGLTVDFMREQGISAMVRGLRSTTDFEFEHPLALVNQKLYLELEVIFLLSKPELTHIHSKFVRELISHKKSLRGFLPEAILADVHQRFGLEETHGNS